MKTIMSCLLLCLITNVYAAPMIINVNPNQTSFLVTLPSNPTTGYQWSLTSYNHNLLKMVSSQYYPNQTKLIGSGGNTVFSFEVVKGIKLPGSTRMEFLYAQAWDPANGTKQKVTVYFKTLANTPVPTE